MIILDVETTGQDYEKNSFFSIGAVDFSNPSNQFYGECKLPEGIEIDSGALNYNGVKLEEINSYQMEQKELLEKFLNWMTSIEDITVCGINVYFDVYFIEAACKRFGFKCPISKRQVELHTLTYSDHLRRGMKPPIKNGKTDIDSNFTMRYVGIPAEPMPHIAINGAKWEAEAFSRLILGKNLLAEFLQYPVPEYLRR